MTEHEKALAIVNELKERLSYREIGEVIGCSWQTVQKKRNGINYNRFTKDNLEKLQEYLKQK